MAHRIWKGMVLIGLLLVVQACATAKMQVSKEAPAAPPKFERVSVLPFDNAIGDSLPKTAPENVAGAIIALLQKEHSGAFREVGSVTSNLPIELTVKGKIVKYDPGSKTARFILIGLGAGDLQLEVAFLNAATGETVEQFSTSGKIIAGGLMGAAMGIDDMINSASKKIVERLIRYGDTSTNPQ